VETVWDWVSVGIFAGLVVLFLQRSIADEPSDRVIDYLPPAVGCALGNYAGNEGQPLIAAAVLALVVGYIWFVLKPLKR